LLPLLIIWFGIGEVSKIVVIALALFPMMSISAMQAVASVSRRKIEAAYSLGADNWTVFRRVLLPASLPGIFTAIRVSLGIGVTMLVGAEMVATRDGIAWMALSASDFLLTDVVLVAVLIMALLGYSLDRLARAIERRVVHWSGKES
jgi:taurine transport system permease protein